MSDDTAREIADLRVEIGAQGEQIKTLSDRADKQDKMIETVNSLPSRSVDWPRDRTGSKTTSRACALTLMISD